jgi:uncharacterized protein
MMIGPEPTWETNGGLSIHPLSAADETEVMDFLSVRPIHTVFLRGFIKENGLVSEGNRGRFYACRDMEKRLLGVALLGHITLVEAHIEPALKAFADYARGGPSIYMILGEQEKVECFWDSYSAGGDPPRQQRREELLLQQRPTRAVERVPELRLATPVDLPILLPVYGEMHSRESGINPLEVDPEGFSCRWLHRINQNQVWVWIRDGKLIFNTDVMCDTSECIYLEGIYVTPEMRGKGIGLRCMSQLTRELLARTKSVCVLNDENNLAANKFFQKLGYETAGSYKTIFLSWNN